MSGRKLQPAQRNVDINADSNTIGEQGSEALESWQQVPTEVSNNILLIFELL